MWLVVESIFDKRTIEINEPPTTMKGSELQFLSHIFDHLTNWCLRGLRMLDPSAQAARYSSVVKYWTGGLTHPLNSILQIET